MHRKHIMLLLIKRKNMVNAKEDIFRKNMEMIYKLSM